MDNDISISHLGLLLYSMEHKKMEACELTVVQLKQLQNLLDGFDSIFAIPIELPPPRAHGHQMQLIASFRIPNIRQYHYGLLQKTEIEKAVQKLLTA